MNLTRFRKSALSAGLFVSLIVGCKRDDSQAYYAPRENTQPPPVQETAPGQNQTASLAPQDMGVPSGLPALIWTVPAGWQEETASGMRVASFTAIGTNGETADVSIIPLPITGHELELVNMWRQQVHLPSATQADADKAFEPVTIAGEQGRLFHFADVQPLDGKPPAGILVAEMSRGTMSWFFKMAGSDSFVAAQKPKFVAFLKSVQFSEQSEALPPGHPAIGGLKSTTPQMAQSAPEHSSQPNWTVPPGWQSVPPEEFLLAEYTVAGANGAKAVVNVAQLAGSGGGVLPNVNRWRRQLGLPPEADADLAAAAQSLTTSAGTATVMDVTGTDSNTGKPARLVGAILPMNDQTWFYKLTGDETVVAQQKDAFLKFVQSANYTNVH